MNSKSVEVIFDALSRFEKVSYTENNSLVTGKYQANIEQVLMLLKEEELDILSENINFQVKIDNNHLSRDELLEYHQKGSIIEFNKIVIVEIMFNKNDLFNLCNNNFIYFSVDSFLKDFDLIKHNVESVYNKIEYYQKMYVYLPIKCIFENKYMAIQPLEDFSGVINVDLGDAESECQRSIIKIRDEISSITGKYPLPQMFIFECGSDDTIRQWINNCIFTSCIRYICNKSLSNNTLLLNGNTISELKLIQDYKADNVRTIYKIFEFIYSDENKSIDKSEIARNIITIYLGNECDTVMFDKLSLKIYDTIKSHFSAYVKNNIKDFFEDRKDIIDETHKFASELNKEASKLVSYINTSLLGLITALLTVSFILARGNNLLLVVALVVHIFYFVWTYRINRNYVIDRRDDLSALYDKYLSNFVILDSFEIDKMREIYIKPAVGQINNYLKKYKNITISLVSMFVFTISIFIIYFFHKELVSILEYWLYYLHKTLLRSV